MTTRLIDLRPLVAALMLASITPCIAADAALVTPGLPPVPTVERALSEYPPVRAARQAVGIDQAGARRLQAGPYEYAIRGGYQSHSLQNGRFPEWDIGVERSIRLPGKAVADQAIGAQNIELARRTAYSAWCDGARHVLKLWFGWARENMQLALWEQQVASLREQQSVVARRAKAGDAPRVELNLAEAAVAQAESVLEGYRGREEGTRAALTRTFPALSVPARAAPGEPRALEHDLDWFVERVRAHNDEVRVARAAALRGRLLSTRAAAERLPDPTVGVRLSNDISQQDRIAGLYVVVPLPGAARQALSDGAVAGAAVAASHEAAVVQRVSAEVAVMFGQANGAYASWTRARAAADGMKRNAESMQRSWQLREASLGDVLIARRLAIESALAATLAQLEAEEARYRLLIEAHILWNDPEEERDPHDD